MLLSEIVSILIEIIICRVMNFMHNPQYDKIEGNAKDIVRSFLAAFSKKANMRIKMIQFYDNSNLNFHSSFVFSPTDVKALQTRSRLQSGKDEATE